MSFIKETEPAWCPGCGNFTIRSYLAEALDELGIERSNLLMVSGIGQAAKMPHYLDVSFFDGLHGRALPVAFAVKAMNPELTVIAESGDGDMYGEGGNHMMANIRRNIDITVLVHDNQIYGLTKGQGSPTTPFGMKTSVQFWGVLNEPLNPIAMGIALNASFVGRTFSGDKDHFKKIIKAAVKHRGFSLVDVFQPCVTFNKLNTFAWYKSKVYDLQKEEPDYDFHDRVKAFEKALETERLPTGIIYVDKRKTFGELHPVLKKGINPSREKSSHIETEFKNFG